MMAKWMIRISLLLILVSILMILMGCNTTIGIGHDIVGIGEGGREVKNWVWNKASKAMKANTEQAKQAEQTANSETEPFFMEVSVD